MLPWKLLFSFVLMVGTFIAMSASSWLMAWMGLEINMLALLPLLMNDKSPRNSEATLKYFLVQALASALLISTAFCATAIFSLFSLSPLMNSLLIISLIIKLGGAPFHIWVPQIIEGFSWLNNLIILSWQKLAPFILLFSCMETNISKLLISFSVVISACVGGISGLSNTSVRKIIAFSSINHMGWMLSSLLSKLSIWMSYFSFYSIILMALILSVQSLNLTNLCSSSFSLSPKSHAPFFTTLLSFGGLPPFMGFLPKLVILNELSKTSMLITLILVLSSLLTLFFYSRLAFTTMMSKTYIMKKANPLMNFNSWILILNLSGMCLTPIIFLF